MRSQAGFQPRIPVVACAVPFLLAGCLTQRSIGGFATDGTTSSDTTGTTTGAATNSSSTGGSAASTSGGTTGTTGGSLDAGAPCSSNAACLSGVCGIDGRGYCCAAACDEATPNCGATGCDSTGACLYPPSDVVCGSPPTCSGSILTTPNFCDGRGNCQGTTDCAPFNCSPSGCLRSCNDTADCAGGNFCDAWSFACCPALQGGGAFAVDSVTGSDTTACCGFVGNGPCQTLARAMQLIDSAQASGVTLHATVNGGGGDWEPPGESYPIGLGSEVELSAPGVYFPDHGGGHIAIFAIAPNLSDDAAGYASIVGSAASPVGIGTNQAGTFQSTDPLMVGIDAGYTLFIANASFGGTGTAITVAAGSTLTLAQDQSGQVTGTVHVGSPSLRGATGIACDDCTITDAPLTGQSSVVIQGQAVDIDVQGGEFDFGQPPPVVSLSSSPIVGIPPTKPGFLECPGKLDGTSGDGIFGEGPLGAIILHFGVMTFSNGTVQCVPGSGFLLLGGTLIVNNSLIQNAGYAGIFEDSAIATVSSSTLRYNYIGFLSSGGDDLSGGAMGGRNTIACNNGVESPFQPPGSPGVGLANYDRTGTPLNASNVDWDTPGPDVFACNDSSVCTCAIDSCTVAPDAGGLDAVNFYANGSILTTGNDLAAVDCTVTAQIDAGP